MVLVALSTEDSLVIALAPHTCPSSENAHSAAEYVALSACEMMETCNCWVKDESPQLVRSQLTTSLEPSLRLVLQGFPIM